MGNFKNNLTFTSVFTFLLFTGQPLFSLDQNPRASLDAHVHFTEDEFVSLTSYDDVQRLLKYESVDHLLLISDGYRKDLIPRTASYVSWAIDKNKELASVVAKDPTRLTGICGVDVLWSEGSRILKECFKNPGMKGVKFHFGYYHESFQIEAQRINFIKLMKVVERHRNRFILIHMNVEGDYISEVQKFFEITTHFPNIKFIVAHGGHPHPDILTWIGNQYIQNPKLVRNVYTDISNAPNFFEGSKEETQSQYLEAWRTFGIDRILFGSDYPLDDSNHTLKLLLNSNLTPEEKQKIIETNGTQFLSAISLE